MYWYRNIPTFWKDLLYPSGRIEEGGMDIIFVSFQRDAEVSSLYFISLQDLSTRFGCSLHPSSGVLKTACATTGTCHRMC
jgi:hypothetical protein